MDEEHNRKKKKKNKLHMLKIFLNSEKKMSDFMSEVHSLLSVLLNLLIRKSFLIINSPFQQERVSQEQDGSI